MATTIWSGSFPGSDKREHMMANEEANDLPTVVPPPPAADPEATLVPGASGGMAPEPASPQTGVSAMPCALALSASSVRWSGAGPSKVRPIMSGTIRSASSAMSAALGFRGVGNQGAEVAQPFAQLRQPAVAVVLLPG